jgi:excisionase family DNA binding protein
MGHTVMFLSVPELADRLGVSRRTAYNLVADRVVPSVRLRGRVRIPARALEEWAAEQERVALASVAVGRSAWTA